MKQNVPQNYGLIICVDCSSLIKLAEDWKAGHFESQGRLSASQFVDVLWTGEGSWIYESGDGAGFKSTKGMRLHVESLAQVKMTEMNKGLKSSRTYSTGGQRGDPTKETENKSSKGQERSCAEWNYFLKKRNLSIVLKTTGGLQ